MPSVLVTGAAGFIGHRLCQRLLDAGCNVIGVDNLSDYYDVRLKQARLRMLQAMPGFSFHQQDVADRLAMRAIFGGGGFDRVIHLAAQVGVRYSLENPDSYIDANLVGMGNILEGCRRAGVRHLVFASSSSIYGANTKLPYSEHDPVDHPVSLYAATKRAGELMAHSYAATFALPTTCLRFFTVYGPWGRPDMALFKFTHAILAGQPIDVFDYGRMRRDFTYVDDVVEAVSRVVDLPATAASASMTERPDPALSSAPFRIFNVGHNQPVELLRLIEILEENLGRTAIKRLLPAQPGEVPATWADVADLERAVGYAPQTTIEDGIARFTRWYQEERPAAG